MARILWTLELLMPYKDRAKRLECVRKYKASEKGKEATRKYYLENKQEIINRSKIWMENNRDARKMINKTWRWKIRLEMVTAYGGKCACCGETEVEFLSIDHINNDGYAKRLAGEGSGATLYKKLKERGWPKEEYQLLCMNCNFAKGHFGECPHTRKQPIPRDFGYPDFEGLSE